MGRAGGPVAIVHGLLLLTGCASTGSEVAEPGLRGVSGPVAWEVANVGRLVSTDAQSMRWSYLIILKETAGSAIRFERLEHDALAGPSQIGGGRGPESFELTLPANSEIRHAFVTTSGGMRYAAPFGGAMTLDPLTVEHRFIGRNAQGREITVVARVRLDRGLGKLAEPVPATSPQLPSRILRLAERASLAGTWRGAYRLLRGGSAFDVPLVLIITPDGSFQAGENDPVTNRLSGTLRVEDDQITYSQRDDTGTLTLHEDGGRRVLFGLVSGPRGSPPTTVSYAVRLEAVAARSADDPLAAVDLPSCEDAGPRPEVRRATRDRVRRPSGLVPGTWLDSRRFTLVVPQLRLELPELPAPAETRGIEAYRAEMVRLIQARWVYPGEAVQRRQAGTAALRFELTQDGSVRCITIDRSSGSAILDRAAVDAVRGARLPAIPDDLGDHVSFTLSFRYRLETGYPSEP